MKTKFTILTALFCYLLSYSQMVVKKLDGTTINNGDIFSYNTVDEESASLKFTVFNNSSTESMLVKIQCTSVSNSDGQEFQFCFGGYCFFSVFEGMMNPMDAPGYLINPGSNTGDADHFWNLKTASTTGQYPMDFKFKIFEVDPLGNEIGTPVNITYRYAGALAVNDVSMQKDITIKNTVIKDILSFDSKSAADLQVIDYSGKLVSQNKVSKGNNEVNLQKLQAGVYILKFSNSEGKSFTSKIIKN